MAYIIDRRENPSGKNLGNRQRFIRRAKDQIKQAVKNSIKIKNLKDLTKGDDIQVPVRDLKQPSFGHDPRLGKRKHVLPGNKEYVEQDSIPRPDGGSGSGKTGAASGEGTDDFVFTLTRDEFTDLFFEDLELPNLTKQKFKEMTAFKLKRAGFTNSGNPTNLDIRQSARQALARRIALKRPDETEVCLLEDRLLEAFELDEENNEEIDALKCQIETQRRRMKIIPWIDPIDVRYRNYVPQPIPVTQAVMFSVMDVSGSMGEREKDIAKRFFLLLHLFLTTKYQKVDIVFIRHTHEAQECDEETFFYDKTTGGTIVSKAFEEMTKIVRERYSVTDWNIYLAQASDGDNYNNDGDVCKRYLSEEILPITQYMAYIEIQDDPPSGVYFSSHDKELWKSYESIKKDWDNFQIKKIKNITEIYPVFRELFTKEAII